MSNLTDNTTALQALLNKANALPDAGASIETCTVTLTGISSPNFEPDTLYYLNELGIGVTLSLSETSYSIKVLKGSIIHLVYDSAALSGLSSGIERILASTGQAFYKVTGDSSATFYYPM